MIEGVTCSILAYWRKTLRVSSKIFFDHGLCAACSSRPNRGSSTLSHHGRTTGQGAMGRTGINRGFRDRGLPLNDRLRTCDT